MRARKPPKLRMKPWSLMLGLTLASSQGLAAPSERADWTVITVLSGAYVDSLQRFLSVGASEKVQVLVLHDTGVSTSVYRVLPDEDPTHAPGECCPAGGACCGRALLPLADLGLTEASRISEETLDRYFSYVQVHYPARRYLLTMRGHASESALSINGSGGRVTVPQLASLLAHFSARRGGKKLEVLNLGMCQTASTDWAYQLAPWVQTFVGSANYTNPPVAMRWRMHLWVRELLRDPTISTRALAGTMVELFADTWDYCVRVGHQCSNASRGEPWTAVAVDVSAMAEVAAAARELVCEASLLEDRAAVQRAVQATAQYGSPGWTRRDVAQFATNLAREVPGTPLAERALALRSAVERAVVAHASEPGTYPADALGLAGAFLQSNAGAELVGPFQVDSLWRPFLELSDGTGFPAASEVRLSPPRVELRVGEHVEVVARGFRPEYGEMCRLKGEWTLSPGAPLSLASPSLNPARAVASGAGAGLLSFQGHGPSATAEVLVRASLDDGGPAGADGGEAASDGGATAGEGSPSGPSSSSARTRTGCSAAGEPPTLAAVLLAAGGLLTRGRRSRRVRGERRSSTEAMAVNLG